jgi:hypothetical protein
MAGEAWRRYRLIRDAARDPDELLAEGIALTMRSSPRTRSSGSPVANATSSTSTISRLLTASCQIAGSTLPAPELVGTRRSARCPAAASTAFSRKGRGTAATSLTPRQPPETTGIDAQRARPETRRFAGLFWLFPARLRVPENRGAPGSSPDPVFVRNDYVVDDITTQDDFRAHRLTISTCSLAPGEAEALASPSLRPGLCPERKRRSR